MGTCRSDMNVLLGCEESQAVCIEFRKRGHNAFSCDMLPCSGGHPEWHLQMDIFEAIRSRRWDLMIAFPPCTYLTNSAEWAYSDGPYHQKVKPSTLVGADRRQAREKALRFVCDLLNAPIQKKAIENPIGQISRRIKWGGQKWEVAPSKTDDGIRPQIIQPWWFGDDASKATCIFRVNLPPLKPTTPCAPRVVNGKNRWSNQTDGGQNKLSPGDDRALLRSKTYPGIARAMAAAWG